MCGACEMTNFCARVLHHDVGNSQIAVGVLSIDNASRLAVCVQERGLDIQHVFIARSGILVLVEALVVASRLL